MKSRYGFIHLLTLLICMLSVTSCLNEVADPVVSTGHLKVSLGNISSDVTNRSTPSEIRRSKGITAEDFTLQIINQKNNYKLYNAEFKADHELPSGKFTLKAMYGENPVIDLDAPYYEGTSETEIIKDQTATAAITCKVANALISVRFDDSFDKFYSNYGVNVTVGTGESASISKENLNQSVYLRAGSSASLEFVGILAENDQQVNTTLDLSNTAFPEIFLAADHAIVTLTLPKNTAVLEISKVELEEATMEETIPLSWMPKPIATPQHQFDANGDLVGTNISFNNGYPGMKWKAVITDGNGQEYRTIEGTGALSSEYTKQDWPYLPAGNYTATYYLLQEGKDPMKTGSRDFTVGNPNIQLTLSGYTSYTKYIEGDTEAANACNANTIYAPGARINVSPSLLTNNKYPHSFTASLDGNSQNVSQTNNQIILENQTSKAARSDAYRWVVNATFDKVTMSQTRDFYITGLPYTAAPPTQSDWSGDANSWRDDYVRLHGNTITKTFYVPANVNVSVAQEVYVRRGTVSTTYNTQISGENLCAYAPAYNTSDTFEETFSSVLKSSDATVKCVNSYGNPDSVVQGTHAKIYKITVQYR